MPDCPQCGMWLVRAAPRRGLFEHLLRLMAIGPLRCQLCTHRFLAVLRQADHSHGRDYERILVQYEVSYRPAFTGEHVQPLEGTMSALSIRGGTINARVSVPKGNCLRLDVRVSDLEPPIQIDAAMVRTVNGTRLGLMFSTIRPEEEERLRRHMMTLLHQRGY